MKAAIQKRWMAGALFCGVMMLTACSTAWITTAEQIVAVLIPATANLMTLVATFRGGVTAADLQAIENTGAQAGADLQLLQSLITAYQKADAAAQPGLLNQIQAAVNDVQSNLNGLLPALHIKDAAMQAKVTAVVGLLLSEVQSMAAIVPLVNPGAAPAMVRLAATQARKQPPLTAGEFAVSFNATMTAKTGNESLDRTTSGLRIHAHGKFERWASAGIVQ